MGRGCVLVELLELLEFFGDGGLKAKGLVVRGLLCAESVCCFGGVVLELVPCCTVDSGVASAVSVVVVVVVVLIFACFYMAVVVRIQFLVATCKIVLESLCGSRSAGLASAGTGSHGRRRRT